MMPDKESKRENYQLTCRLRTALSTDIQELTEISENAFATDIQVGAPEAGGPPGWNSQKWYSEMQVESHLFSFTENGCIIGGAVLFISKTELVIGRIFIKPELFRRKLGMHLMTLIETAFGRGRIIKLDTPVWNRRTNAFYRKCGYDEVARDEDCVFFQKNLTCCSKERTVTIQRNSLTESDVMRLYLAVGWIPPGQQQIRKALEHTLCSFAAVCNGQVIGMVRLLGDWGMSFYIKDFAILPEFQHRGVGTFLLRSLEKFLWDRLPEGWVVSLELGSARGKEPFYRKMGFDERPGAQDGAGMFKMLWKPPASNADDKKQ